MTQPSMRCPTCGTPLDVVQVAQLLTDRQKAIEAAIPVVAARTGRKTARTKDIAAEVGWSQRTVQMECHALVHLGRLDTPNGAKSGYAIKKPKLAIVRAA